MGKNFCEEEKSSELRIKVSQVFSKQSFLSSSSQVRKLKDFFREKKNSNELRNNSFQENRLSQIAFTLLIRGHTFAKYREFARVYFPESMR